MADQSSKMAATYLGIVKQSNYMRRLNSTANIKAVRGSLWSISVNKRSHIPKLQSVSVVYKKQ